MTATIHSDPTDTETDGTARTEFDRHLLVVDDGHDTLRTALEWARHQAGPNDLVTVLTTYSHLHAVPFSAECPVLIDGDGDLADIARRTAEQAVADVFGADVSAHRHRVIVEAGYVHRVVERYACEATDVVIARPDSGRWPDRLTPSPARRLAGRMPRPLVIVPHDWAARPT